MQLIGRINATAKIEATQDDVDLNLSIEMETGTGKTYTYIRTIYELHKVYGFCKFVIVVPSVAIREGTLKNLVFQICTLNESASEMKKRQEVGRGLRLPVNSQGERITDKNINLLTMIANESYEAFTKALQTEIEEDTGVKFTPHFANANRDKVIVKLSKKELTRENYPQLFALWDKISYKTQYAVHYNENTLIQKALHFIKDENYYPPVALFALRSSTAKISMASEGLGTEVLATATSKVEKPKQVIPDVFGFVQSRINVSRNAILTLLQDCGRIHELTENPQRFLEYVVAVFERARNEILLEEGGIQYEKGAPWDLAYTQKLFGDELGEVLQDLVIEVSPNATDKTPFSHYRIDSTTENNFARDCETNEAVKYFFKIPKGFKIPTPMNNYTPDWAVVLEGDNKIYFVAETKGTKNPDDLRGKEKIKIRCGEKFFADLATGVRYKLVTKVSDLRIN